MHTSCVEGDCFYGWVFVFVYVRVIFRFLVRWFVWCICGISIGGALCSIPVFVLFKCGLFVFGCVHGVSVGHYVRCWECHADARWRLRHRALFNGGLGLLT